MKKYKGWIITIIVLSCLFFMSCASHQEYPLEWGRLVLPQGAGCPDISGTYINLGEGADKKSSHLSLLFDFDEAPSTVTRVQIRQLDDYRLEISCWDEQKLLSRKDYSKMDHGYICSSNGLEIPIGKEEKAAGGTGAKVTLSMVKSADGALVIERKSTTGGYSLMYIPVVSGSYEWFRFSPADVRK